MKRRRPDDGPSLFDSLPPEPAPQPVPLPAPVPTPTQPQSQPDLCSEQQAAIELPSNRLVAASAGTGKTTTLSAIYLELLTGHAEPLRPSQIVAVTFTDKAAAELRERLSRALARRRKEATHPAMQAHLARCWEELPAAPVSTIHSFCSRLLRQAGAQLHVPPGFVTLTGEQARETFKDAMVNEAAERLDRGDPELTALVREWGIGAESGLVAVCKALVHELRWRGLDPSVLPRDGDGPESLHQLQEKWSPLIQQLLAAAPRIRSKEKKARLLGLSENADGPGDFATARRTVLGYFDDVTGASEFYAAARDTEAPLREALGLCHTPQRKALADFLSAALLRYQHEKRKLGALDFDDLLLQARGLLRAEPAIGRRYRFVLIDEFQDTDPLQKDILYRIAFPESGGVPKPQPPRLVVVGDRKQSIYRFRGADVSLIQTAADELPTRALKRNFRSRRALVEWVNAFCEKTLWPAGTKDAYTPDDRMTAGMPDPRHAWAGPPGELLIQPAASTATRADERRWEQAQAIARRIRTLIAPPTAGELPRPCVWDRGEKGLRDALRYGDIAILARSLRSLRAPLELALGRYRIPFQMLGGVSFFTRAEVLDTINLLACVADPSDVLARTGLLRSPFALLSDGALFRLSTHDAWASPEKAGLDEPDRQAVQSIQQCIAFLRKRLGQWTAAEMMDYAYQKTGFLSVLAMQPQGEVCVAAARRLIEWARDFESQGANTLHDLVLRLRTEADAEWDDPGREGRPDLSPDLPLQHDAVSIGTVHSAKGLEFPIVILPELGFGRGPQQGRANFTPEHRTGLKLGWSGEGLAPQQDDTYVQNAEAKEAGDEAESRRLLYVALTRACDYLILAGEPQRGRSGWRALLDAEDRLADEENRPRLLRLPYDHSELKGAQPADEPGAWRFEDGRLKIAHVAGPAPDEATAQRVRALLNAGPQRPDSPVQAHLECSVTALTGFLSCPRRYALLQARITEKPAFASEERADPREAGDGDTDDARGLGRAAHAAMECAFASCRRADVEKAWRQALADEQLDATTPAAQAIWEKVQRVQDGAWARGVLRLPAERRFVERPFRWRIETTEGTLTLIGVLDLLTQNPDGTWQVVDYKFPATDYAMDACTSTPAERESLARYAWQAGLYALAAAQALGVRPEEVRPQLLLAQCDEPLGLDALPFAPALPARLPVGAPKEVAVVFLRALRQAAQAKQHGSGIESDLTIFEQNYWQPGTTQAPRTADRCRAEGCPFVGRCFGATGDTCRPGL